MRLIELVSIPKPETPLIIFIDELNNVAIPIPAGPINREINFVRIIEIIILKNCTPPMRDVVFKIFKLEDLLSDTI